MKRKSHSNDDSPQEAVQSYVDMMLNPVSTPKVSQLSDRVVRPALNDVTTPLTMVAGTATALPSRRKRHGDTLAGKPFREPVKPLALKMPLPVIKSKKQDKVEITQKESAKHVIAITPDEETSLYQANTSEGKTPNITVEPLGSGETTDIVSELSANIETTRWMENGRPDWAQERFECLLFSVGGLTLAVPLVELGTIYPLDEGLTSIFGQADWFLGLLSVRELTIRTVNTAKVVLNERYNDSMKENFSYVITLDGVDWGLAVDHLSTAITLDPEDVRWRGERSKRPWLAGTVIEKMCSLLDVSQLAAMFVEQDQRRR